MKLSIQQIQERCKRMACHCVATNTRVSQSPIEKTTGCVPQHIDYSFSPFISFEIRDTCSERFFEVNGMFPSCPFSFRSSLACDFYRDIKGHHPLVYTTVVYAAGLHP